MALGYTMVYGIIQLINFAHGEVVMIGAHGRLHGDQRCWRRSGLPPLAIVLIGAGCAMPVCMLVGYAIERLAYRPLRARAAPGAAHHRDRRVDHPAAPRAAGLEPQHPRLPADHPVAAPTFIGGAAITTVQIAIIVHLPSR